MTVETHITTPSTLLAKQIQRAFMVGENGNRDGQWTIQLDTDKAPRTYKIQTVQVFPEGAPAYGAYAFDLNGDELNTVVAGRDVLYGRVAVVDLGFGTADAFIIEHGELVAEHMRKATDNGGGLKKLIHETAQTFVMDTTRLGKHVVTHTLIDRWFREWLKGNRRSHLVMLGGKEIDTAKIFSPLADLYSDYVLKNIVAPMVQPGVGPAVNSILAVGGGWYVCEKYIRKHLSSENLLVTPDMLPQTSGIPVHHLNGYGTLPSLAAIMKRGGEQ